MDAPNEIARSIGRLEGKVDQLIHMVEKHFEDDRQNFSALGKRIANVEKKAWYGAGAAAVVTFVVAKIGLLGLLAK